MYGFGRCSCGRLMLSPIVRPPASAAPRFAASMMPPPPPLQTRNRRAGDGIRQRPFGHQARELARLGVVARKRSVGAHPRGAEEHDGVMHARALERVQGLEVLGEDAERPRGVTVEKRLVAIGEL